MLYHSESCYAKFLKKFILLLHLNIFENGRNFEEILLSCFTYIILRVDILKILKKFMLLLHLYLFDNARNFEEIYSHASLIPFWELKIIMVNCTSYELGPHVMNIQEGNENYHNKILDMKNLDSLQ